MAPLKIGIVGTGIFASQTHLPTIQALPEEFVPVAAYNRTKSKAEAFAQTAGIAADKVHDTLEGIVSDPDVEVVDVLVPVQYNLPTLKTVVGHGKPVIMEKPIAATLEDAKAIVELDRSTDVPILIAENWLYSEATKKIQERLSRVGNVISFTYRSTGPFNTGSAYLSTPWRMNPEHIGGYLSDGGVHQLALLTDVLGPIASVSALTKQVRAESGNDDIWFSTMRSQQGAIGTFTYGSAFGATEKVGEFIIYGDAGSIKCEWGPKRDSKITVMVGSTAAESKVDEVIEFPEHSGITQEFENLHEAVVKKDKSLIKSRPEVVFHHLAIVAAALESSKKNGDSVTVQTV